MKSIKCYFTPFLALAAVCNLLPAGSIALTGNAENGLIVEESFEMGASFVADATHTAAYSTTDAVAWNDAVPAQGSFLQVDPATVAKHPVLSGGVGDAHHGSSCISVTIDGVNYPDDTANVKNQAKSNRQPLECHPPQTQEIMYKIANNRRNRHNRMNKIP